MSIPSGSELEPPGSAEQLPSAPEVPLADLPLVADHQQTVVSSKTDNANSGTTNSTSAEVEYADPSEILFSTDGSDTIPGSVRLEHFEVRRRIGSGGMGKVFLAEDVALRRPVALKVLNPGSAGDPALLARFQNEARAAALLRHDNIAQVYYTGASHGIHFIACEYIAGRTLRDLIDEYETLPPDLVVNYALQATLALNHMDASGVIHRDIKPSNIIVSNEGRVKIVDLGLARRDSPDSVCDITVAGSTLGTFDYLAPEQARDPRQADIRSDIYSLGCTLYHMLTGQPPYPEGTALQKLLDHQGKQAPDPARINSRVPSEIADIVLTMMKTDPADRYQSPAELLSELIEVATDMGLQGVPADGVVWQQVEEPAVRRLSGAMILLLGVLAFCITAVSLHLIPDGAEADYPRQSSPDQSVPAPNPGTPAENANTSEQDTGSENTEGVPQPVAVAPYIVRYPNGNSKECSSLGEALGDALLAPKQTAQIELTFSGLSQVPVKQLPRLDHQTVVIYASEGAQPILEFRGDPESPDGTSMFRLKNSNLTLDGIAIRMVPNNQASNATWSVFDCAGATYLNLQRCSIDVQGDGSTKTSICWLKEFTTANETEVSTDILLSEVIVRGAADMFRVAAQTTGRIRLRHCGIGIEGHFINNTGSTAMETASEIQVALEQVTCVVGAPFIRIAENEVIGARRTLAPIHVNSRASVFCSAGDNEVFVDSYGIEGLIESQELLNWDGDTNLYSGFDVFWSLEIAGSDQEAPQKYNKTEWENYWARRGTSAREMTARVFKWDDAKWRTAPDQPDGSSALTRLQRDWLEVDGDRFSGPEQLPRYLDRENPGVAARKLPAFPEADSP